MTAVDTTGMREAMGRFATGVSVVTALAEGGAPHGMTVNSLTSVSLDPPLILVSLMPAARTTAAVTASGRFAVSVLAARQETIARRFATPGDDHFVGLPLTYGDHRVPVVPDALAHVECTVNDAFDAGDHVIVLGAVERLCFRDGEPLAFFGGHFGDYRDRGHDPMPWFF
ncbi:MAG: flavin reductase family protein [Acidimicrobiales bacterium]